MIIILLIISLLLDGLFSTNSLIILSSYISLNIYKIDFKYYMLLFTIGIIADILFTETIMLNAFLIPLIGYLNFQILNKINKKIFTNIILVIMNIIIYKIIFLMIMWCFKSQNIININILQELILCCLKNIPIIILFNIKDILSAIKYRLKSKFPSKLYIMALNEKIRFYYKNNRKFKRIGLIIFLIILSISLSTKRIVTVDNLSDTILFNINTFYQTTENINNIKPESVDNILYFNISLKSPADAIQYEVELNNNKNNIIRLENVTKTHNENLKVEIIDLNKNIIILPKTKKTFYIKINTNSETKNEFVKIKLDFIEL